MEINIKIKATNNGNVTEDKVKDILKKHLNNLIVDMTIFDIRYEEIEYGVDC